MRPGARNQIRVCASPWLARVLVHAIVVWAMSGCGPVRYIKQVTLQADASVAAAKAAGADELAPYEYTLAVEYLHKAREEAAFADFEAAHRFGRRAHEAALEARKLAIRRAADPDDTSWRPPAELGNDQAGGHTPRRETPAAPAARGAQEANEQDKQAPAADRQDKQAPEADIKNKSPGEVPTPDTSAGAGGEGGT